MDKKLIRDEALSLEGDGIIPKIYNLLTYKDPICGTMPSICLPDTIMFSYDIPEVWYFGNSKGVRRKLKLNVTLENIEKAFLKDVPKHGIVAQYIALSPDQKTTPLTFTYIRKDELKSFLYSKKPNGILQRFVNPKGLNNFVLKVNWSSNFCLFEKVENLMKLDDETVDLYHRAMTLEGRDYQTRTIPLRGSVLPHKLEKLAYHVSHHIKNATMENIIIARMTLVFKIDDEGKLWFLYCTNLRVQPHEDQIHENQYGPGNSLKPTNLNINLSSPSSINAYKSVFPKTKSLKKVYQCQNCDKDLDCQQFFNIQLYQVINEYENDRQIHYTEDMRPQKKNVKKYGVSNIPQARPEEMDVHDATIPRVVSKLYPEIRQAEYEVLRREPGFLYQEVKVCEDCYLKFSNNFEYVQDPKAIMKEYETFIPKGTGGLRPDIVDRRRLASKAHGKIKATQLGSLLRVTKQRMCVPTDSYDIDRSESRERPGKEFNEVLIQVHKTKRAPKAFLHCSVVSLTKDTSQPKIPEENLTDQSIERPAGLNKLQPAWGLDKRSRKVATSQVAKRNQTVSKSPDTTEPVFLRNQTKSIMSHDKIFTPILSPVGSKKAIHNNRTDTVNQDSTTINPHALTMTSFRQAGKINDDNEWQTSQAKSKERVLKVYGSKAFNNLMSNLKKENIAKMPKLPWND